MYPGLGEVTEETRRSGGLTLGATWVLSVARRVVD
jgi:hypothetical protein